MRLLLLLTKHRFLNQDFCIHRFVGPILLSLHKVVATEVIGPIFEVVACLGANILDPYMSVRQLLYGELTVLLCGVLTYSCKLSV